VYDSARGQDVRHSFQALATAEKAHGEADEQLLRIRVLAATDELKAMGWPVERIIVRMKELAWEVGLYDGYAAHQADKHPTLARAVLWCVERYYDADVVRPRR
jgi:hypothetical protein